MTSAIVQTEVETAALAIYTCSVWESSHTFSFTAALVIHTLEYFSWKHAHSLSMFCIILPDLGCCSLHLITVQLNTCSVELPGGVLAMNNVILTKWRIALSIKIGVLESHGRIARVLR